MKAINNDEMMQEPIDQMIESIHRAAKMDRRAGVQKLALALERKKAARKLRRLYLAAGSVAAAAALYFAAGESLVSERRTILPEVVAFNTADVTIPTIYTVQGDSVLSSDTLDLENQDTFQMMDQAQTASNDEVLASDESPRAIRYSKIVIPKGYTYKVQLSDGTKITLNAGSELKYPVKFQDSAREVEFTGQGFFDVAKGEVPFVVTSGQTHVKVYGTRFNFMHSHELSLSEVVLLEGSVGMTAGGEEVKIAPGERVYHTIGDRRLSVEKVDPSEYTAWMGSTFKYIDASLERIAYDLSRWYGIAILLSPQLKGQLYTLEFDKSASVEQIMQGLAQISGSTVTKEGGRYMLY